MAVRTPTQYKALYGSSGTVFPDNTTGDISETDMRSFGEDTADSLAFKPETYDVYPLSTTGTNTYIATAAYSITAYSFKRFYVKFTNASTGASTLNVSTLGTKKIYKDPTTQVGSGDLIANQIYDLVYDATLDGAAGGFLIVNGISTSGGANDIDIVTVSTAGGTITFGFGGEEETIFIGSASFGSAKDIVFDDDSNAKKLSFSLNITNVLAVLTFPSSVIMSDVRWEATGAKEWQPDATGVYKGTAFFDGTNWIMDISAAPYV